MITEVFVSLNGLNFTKLDLENDESIPMRYTFKDTQDISKVFSPYSLNFTFVATPNNLLSLGHFGNTDVLKSSDLRKIKCKIYVNSILNQTGLLKLEKITYKMGKPDIITASFATNMTNLKDKIGEDTIDMLGSKVVDYLPKDVLNALTSIAYTDTFGIPMKWFVPLASTNRVWQYSEDGSGLDNIFFNSANSPTSNKVITTSELRPAITFSSIVELIKRKYNLLIVSPLETRSEYRDAYVWCMGETFGSSIDSKFIIKNALNFTGVGFNVVMNHTLSSVKVNKLRKGGALNWLNFFTHRIKLEGITYLGNNTNVSVSVVRVGESLPIINSLFELSNTTENLDIQISDAFLTNEQIEYFVFLKFNNPITWSNSKVEVIATRKIFNALPFTSTASLNTNNNSQDMGGYKIDLVKSLPKVKVIDFLTSYFKAFNIAVLDVSPDDNSLFWYTPQDIAENKKEVTYVADISDVEKSTQDDFNYYVFKHADSNFKSNTDYKIGAGQNYGQTSFPEIKPENAKEYKVETGFTIIPPVNITGTDIKTMYGFEGGAPDILDTGEARYTPNFGELVVFYSHGNSPLGRSFGVQSSLLNGNLTTQSISSFIKVLPYTTDLKSFSWSVLVLDNLALRDTLFSRYYIEIIKRYIDQNVMKQEFSLTLSANEIRAFKVENDIIIGENRFTIIDSTIDPTTGKTKLTLLNY